VTAEKWVTDKYGPPSDKGHIDHFTRSVAIGAYNVAEENTHRIYDELIVFTDELLDMLRDYFPNNSEKLAIIQKQIKQIKQYRDKE
jgi:hypothetical protein